MADQEVQKRGDEQMQHVVVKEEEPVVDIADVPPDDSNPTPTSTQIPPTIAVVQKEPPLVPETEEEPVKPQQFEENVQTDMVPKGGDDNQEKMPQLSSFKEETSKVADLQDSEKKALQELKKLVQQALNNHEFSALTKPTTGEEKKEAAASAEEEKQSSKVAVPPAPAEQHALTETDQDAKTKDHNEAENIEVSDDNDIASEEKIVAATHSGDAVDDDGAKTVEAIEETIVAVSSSASLLEQTLPEEKETEARVAEALNEETKEVKCESSPVLPEEVSIWGIPLLADERSDVILLKFLRARDFKTKDAFTMLKNTIRWRKEFGIDVLLGEDLGDDLEKVVFMNGHDKEGHPVCYNVYGEFQNKKLYQKTFSDEEGRQRFLRWRIQFLEKSIRKLDFTSGGICTIVQVNDLKNSPGPAKRELRLATKQALRLLQDNYPEFVEKQIFINVPWWYLTVNKMISPFLTQRTRSKFVFAGSSKSAETLIRYIAVEQIPVKYGGLNKDGDFSTADTVTEVTVKPAAKHSVEFPVTEACLLSWEVQVMGWDVSYGAEFVPSGEESYTVIIQKARKIAAAEEAVVYNSFKVSETGKVVLTIDNATSKKKKLLYRLKTRPCSD